MAQVFSDETFPAVAAKMARFLVEWYGEEMLRECTTKETATSGQRKKRKVSSEKRRPSKDADEGD